MAYLLDTNIISSYLNNNTLVSKRIAQEIINDEVYMSAISYYEIKRGLFFESKKNKDKLSRFNGALDTLFKGRIILLDDIKIFEVASQICVKFDKITAKTYRDDDILIAATCMVKGMDLATSDNDFSEMSSDIKVEDWGK